MSARDDFITLLSTALHDEFLTESETPGSDCSVCRQRAENLTPVIASFVAAWMREHIDPYDWDRIEHQPSDDWREALE